ncbi:MAG: metallophosphatase family protein [Verrucomicrobiota bacterium]|nr:metallophosphoesterase family protein [Chthoniobacterales bacterium]MBA3763416.1 metallophosphoesterase family protein [Chthoniobacterales bacterium]MDQ3313411.1 metallophosphatase family protein [Verrucomicrobiota bacterium]
MRFAVFSDLHANLEATEAVLADARQKECTHYICLGDVVGYNANPHECVDLVRKMNCPIVKGNHDEQACLAESSRDFNDLAERAIDWTRANLTADDKQWLSEARMTRQVRDFTIVHATLDTPGEWGYVFNNLDAVASFTYQHTTVCFFGHTHVAGAFVRDDGVKRVRTEQLMIEPGKKYFINTGSVGQPRDGDPRAAYCIYHTDRSVVEQRRIRYDLPKAQRKIVAAGLPRLLAERLELGR